MQTILNYLSRTVFVIILFTSCKKESDILTKPAKKLSPLDFKGFVIGEPLEQYFDGEKVRDLYGKIQLNYPAESMIAFMSDQTEMELRRKGSGEVVYRQTFRIEEASHKVPRFYFDGKWKNGYEYPVPAGNDFLVNFYFDVPADSSAADIYITVVEYYWDWDDVDNPQKILRYHDLPVQMNVKNSWSGYVTLSKIPDLPKLRPDSEFWPMPCLKKAGTDKYYVNNDVNRSIFYMQSPQGWESQGSVQSLYLGFTELGNLIVEDLVPLYPK